MLLYPGQVGEQPENTHEPSEKRNACNSRGEACVAKGSAAALNTSSDRRPLCMHATARHLVPTLHALQCQIVAAKRQQCSKPAQTPRLPSLQRPERGLHIAPNALVGFQASTFLCALPPRQHFLSETAPRQQQRMSCTAWQARSCDRVLPSTPSKSPSFWCQLCATWYWCRRSRNARPPPSSK